MFNDCVVVNVSFNFCAVAFDQGTVVFEGLNELQNAADIIMCGFAQLFKFFVHHHGANTVMDINFKQQCAIHSKRQDVTALNTLFARLYTMLQIKSMVGWHKG